MSKFVCSVCGYVYEGEAAPKECPICHAPAEKFNKVEETAITWADEHKVGVAEGLDEEVVAGLRENFNGECSEVGMYLVPIMRGIISRQCISSLPCNGKSCSQRRLS